MAGKLFLLGIRYNSGGTNTGDALKFVGSNIFQPSSGDRINARNILVVITDGRSNNHLSTIAQANHLKNNNILIIAVGIGSGISKSELDGMASVTTIHPTLKPATTTTAAPTTTTTDEPTTTMTTTQPTILAIIGK
ncbi:collagen alpha-1(XII) chain-like [Mytilus californianus]|uniref:collagen alpha-1(XII) chain-like n=1 Tax=Mytilus californianus TaxID=6549 RepID=UPI00224796F4|nr:collagen alpha-1(XII) chain-like [Mytilus californianus]